MRIDPEAVYVQLEPGALSFSFTENKATSVNAASLHWKDDRGKWRQGTFVASEGESLGAALRQIADGLDTLPDLQAFLTKIEEAQDARRAARKAKASTRKPVA